MKELIKEYFDLEELICPHVSANYGERAWQFLDRRLLETVYVIRRGIDAAMYVNNWSYGGTFTQRGLRCNICQLVKSKTDAGQVTMSAHPQGEAVDFTVKGMSANETRLWIVKNQVLLPHPIRLEVGFNPRGMTEAQIRQAIASDKMNWVHLDMRGQGQKITFFQG